MSDQASGLRLWAQHRGDAGSAETALGKRANDRAANEKVADGRRRGAELVVAGLSLDEQPVEAIAKALAALPLPEGVTCWTPRPLPLEGPLDGALSESPWWALWLAPAGADTAPRLAAALRRLAERPVPTRLLLLGETQGTRGLCQAARQHLGLELTPDASVWLEATVKRR